MRCEAMHDWSARVARAMLASAVLAAGWPATGETAAVYVSIGGEDRIAVYHLDAESGELDGRGSVTVGDGPGALATDPERKFLYAALRGSASVAALAIDRASGGLTPLGTTGVAANPAFLQVDPSGGWLLSAYYSADKIAVYPIAADGRLGQTAAAIVETGRNPHSIHAEPSGRFVFVPNTGADQILQFRFDRASGRLSPATPAALETESGSGPRHFCFHPGGRFAYVVNEKNSSVTALAFDAGRGTLSAIQSVSTLPADYAGRNTCADIEITPSGKFLYASNRGHDSLAMYAVDGQSGRLAPLGQQATERTPREMAIDPGGRFVLAAGQGSGRLASYRIDEASGRLAPLAIYEVGKSPSWVLVVPTKR